jgi:DNA-binding MarR family transcriptional regulator
MSEKEKMIDHITNIASEIFREVQLGVPPELLSADITLAQLRVLLVLRMGGPRRMSAIAGELGVSLPTVTGVVDKLVTKGFVSRQPDDGDRRVVIALLSDAGSKLTEKIWEMGRFKLADLLEKLDEKDLRKAAEVTDTLLARVKGI